MNSTHENEMRPIMWPEWKWHIYGTTWSWAYFPFAVAAECAFVNGYMSALFVGVSK